MCHNVLLFSYLGFGEANSSSHASNSSHLPSSEFASKDCTNPQPVLRCVCFIPPHYKSEHNCLAEVSQLITWLRELSGSCSLSRYLPGCSCLGAFVSHCETVLVVWVSGRAEVPGELRPNTGCSSYTLLREELSVPGQGRAWPAWLIPERYCRSICGHTLHVSRHKCLHLPALTKHFSGVQGKERGFYEPHQVLLA